VARGGMMRENGKMKKCEVRYLARLDREARELAEFLDSEKITADMVLYHFKRHKIDMDDDVYRGIVYFLNDEYKNKPGSLTMLLNAKSKIIAGLPPVTKETTIDYCCYIYKFYAKLLVEGGY
jgi:hypothetical protein